MGSDDKPTNAQGAKISTQELFGDFLGEVESAWDAGLVAAEEKDADRGASVSAALSVPVQSPSRTGNPSAEPMESLQAPEPRQTAGVSQEGGIVLDGLEDTAPTEVLDAPEVEAQTETLPSVVDSQVNATPNSESNAFESRAPENELPETSLGVSALSGAPASEDLDVPAASSLGREGAEDTSIELEEPISQEAVRQKVALEEPVPAQPTGASPSIGPDLAIPLLARFTAELQREEGQTEPTSIEETTTLEADLDQVESVVLLDSGTPQLGAAEIGEPPVDQPLASDCESAAAKVEAIESTAYMPWMEDGSGTNWARLAAMALLVGVFGLIVWWFAFRQTTGATDATGATSSAVSTAADVATPIAPVTQSPEQTIPAAGELIPGQTGEQADELTTAELAVALVSGSTEVDGPTVESSGVVATQERISAWLDSEMAVREQRLRAVFDEQRRQIEEEIARIELATTGAVVPADTQADQPGNAQTAVSTEVPVQELAQQSAAEESGQDSVAGNPRETGEVAAPRDAAAEGGEG